MNLVRHAKKTDTDRDSVILTHDCARVFVTKDIIYENIEKIRDYDIITTCIPVVNTLVYCENDNEALGAIEALEAAGKKIGSDIRNGEIMVVSFDGVSDEARMYVTQDKISCIAECNPLHGPRVEAIIDKLENGMEPDKWSYVDEGYSRIS